MATLYSKTFCPLPFMHSHHSVAGKFKPCCNAESPPHKGNPYTTKDHSLFSWFDSQPMRQLRQDLLNGVQNPMCNICWKQEETGGKSYRHSSLNKVSHDNGAFKQSYLKEPKITFLDLKFSNECNFACRMCDYTNSHQILKDMTALEDNNIELPNHWRRSPTQEKYADPKTGIFSSLTIEDVLRALPTVRILKVTGGEPMISKPFVTLLDHAIEKGYTDQINLYITTNASKFNDTIMKKILKFRKVYFTVSCDGYGTTYDYIRYPYKWKMFSKRITDFLEQHQHEHDTVRLGFSTVPQIYNIENIHKLTQWIADLDKKYGATDGDGQSKCFISHHIQTHLWPTTSELQYYNAPVSILKNTYDALQKLLEQDTSRDFESFLHSLKHSIDNYGDTSPETNKDIIKTTVDIDKVRNQDYSNLLEKETVKWLNSL